jgi:hypothetical protein
MLLVGDLRRPPFLVSPKELDGDTQIAKQQQNFIERKSIDRKIYSQDRPVDSGQMAQKTPSLFKGQFIGHGANGRKNLGGLCRRG